MDCIKNFDFNYKYIDIKKNVGSKKEIDDLNLIENKFYDYCCKKNITFEQFEKLKKDILNNESDKESDKFKELDEFISEINCLPKIRMDNSKGTFGYKDSSILANALSFMIVIGGLMMEIAIGIFF